MIKYIFSLARDRVLEFEVDPDRSPESGEEMENLPFDPNAEPDFNQ